MSDLRGDIMKNRPKTGFLPPEPEAPGGTGEWLTRIRTRAEDESPKTEAPAPAAPDQAAMPSWLSDIREREQTSYGRGPVVPEPAAEAPSNEVPSWLSKVRDQVSSTSSGRPPVATPPPQASPVPKKAATPPPPQAVPPSAKKDEEPPWLKRVRSRHVQDNLGSQPLTQPESAPVAPAAPVGDDGLPDWLAKVREKNVDVGGQEDQSYLSSVLPPAQPAPTAPFGGGKSRGSAPLAQQPPAPSWLPQTPEPPAAGSTASEPALPDWLAGAESQNAKPLSGKMGTVFPPSAVETPTVPSAPLPWEGDAGAASAGWDFPGAAAETPFPGGSFTSPIGASAFEAGTEPMVSPSGEESPDWLLNAKQDASTSAAEEEEESPIPAADLTELLHPDSIPAWMTKAAPAEASKLAELEESPAVAGDGLEHADLPRWLEAMRPIQAMSVAEEDEHVENAGPLAGLRGVISAEPVVAMPRRPQVMIGNIDASPAQTARADLLQRMILEPEFRPVRKAARNAWAVPLTRRLIAVAMIVVTVLPTFGWNLFSNPVYIPPVTRNAGSVVEGLPTDKTVLAAVEFDSSAEPEMEIGMRAVLEHLARRGISIAVVSTEPAGPTLAEFILSAGTEERKMPAVVRNFGFLPGGASGLRALATDFRRAVALPDSYWVEGPLSAIHSVADFSMILVVSARPQTVREWVEQIHTTAPQVPMVAVVSASSDALVFPYTEGYQPSLAGLVSGYAGAEAYSVQFLQKTAGGESDLARWQAFGMGNCAAMVILMVGMAASAALLVVRKPQGRKS